MSTNVNDRLVAIPFDNYGRVTGSILVLSRIGKVSA